LGNPDIRGAAPGEPDLWIDRDLEFIGRTGAKGTLAMLGSFAVAVPPYARLQTEASLVAWAHGWSAILSSIAVLTLLLRSTGLVDCVQGYVISRLLGIDDFAAFLTTRGKAGGDKQLAA
jgi:hypothetical protein